MASPASKVHSSSHVFILLPYHPPGLPDSRISVPYPVADTARGSIKRMINSNAIARSFFIACPPTQKNPRLLRRLHLRKSGVLCLLAAFMGILHDTQH
jgi:hypothetical protein